MTTEPTRTVRLAAARKGSMPLGQSAAVTSKVARHDRSASNALFKDKTFISALNQLCDSGSYEDATKYFIDHGSSMLSSKLNMKEKLNHLLYMSRQIQSGGGAKHGYVKLLRKAKIVEDALADVEVPSGGAFIDLGCGAHDPLAMATYYYLNGFSPCYGIDLLTSRNSRYSAFSMYDIVTNARSFPKRYCRGGTDPGNIQRRLLPFALASFEDGRFDEGFQNLKDKIMFDSKDICDAEIKDESVSLLISFAVLEHVSDIGKVCRRIYELLKPGGVAYHFVDLSDHRAYRGDGVHHPLSFLTEETVPSNMNRLRAPEITRAHLDAGFELVRDRRGAIDIPAEIEERLQPKFKAMSLDDVTAIKQEILVRKPS